MNKKKLIDVMELDNGDEKEEKWLIASILGTHFMQNLLRLLSPANIPFVNTVEENQGGGY